MKLQNNNNIAIEERSHFFRYEKNRKLLLSAFNKIVFAVSHASTLTSFPSILFFTFSVEALSKLQLSVISSVKRVNLKKLEHFGKSLINIENKNGPRMEPCGTPQLIVCISDDLPFSKTHCLLYVKYDSNHFKAIPLAPNFFIFFGSILWFTQSNAFRKSKNKDKTIWFLTNSS